MKVETTTDDDGGVEGPEGRGGQGERIEQRETNKCASNARSLCRGESGRGRREQRLAFPLVVLELVCHSHRRFGFVLREDGKVVIGEGD